MVAILPTLNWLRRNKMTNEKRAKLLHHAADNPKARFVCEEYGFITPVSIKFVLENTNIDWEIYEEPKDEVSYDC
jgi:hypothetical protein